MIEIIKKRGGLPNAAKALAVKKISVGFIGGSITDQRAKYNWPEYAINYFTRQEGVFVTMENVAIGGTGSDLAVFRAQRQLIDKNCDLVFVEFAVNDYGTEREQRERQREGLLRQLLKSGKTDVVLVYVYCGEMYPYLKNGELPPSVSDFEKLAEYYNVSSVFSGYAAFEKQSQGLIRYEEWLPDGLHPSPSGAAIYSDAVVSFVKDGLSIKDKCVYKIQPLNINNWENVREIDFRDLELKGNWRKRFCTQFSDMPYTLFTCADGAGFKVNFNGRGIAVAVFYGSSTAKALCSIDGEEFEADFDRTPQWMGECGFFRFLVLKDGLGFGPHTLTVTGVHTEKNGCKGCTLEIPFIAEIL